MADDQRRGSVGLLRRGHRAVPHQRSGRVRAAPIPGGLRRRRLPRPRGRRAARARPLGCGPTSASTAQQRLARVPHPSGHRTRRVHDGRQRQHVHERDGALQPALRRPHGPVPGGVEPAGVRGAPARHRPRPRRTRRMGRRRRCDVHPVRRGAGHPSAGRVVPRTRAVGLGGHARSKLSRCCSTTTRSSSTAIRCSSRPTSCWPRSCGASTSRPEQKRRNFDYYDPITTGDSSLSACVQSIVAAEVGYDALALDYFHRALYLDLCDAHGNTADGVHVANAGGVWAGIVHGFAGMVEHGDHIEFAPRLPASWDARHVPSPPPRRDAAGRPRPRTSARSPSSTASACRSATATNDSSSRPTRRT